MIDIGLLGVVPERLDLIRAAGRVDAAEVGVALTLDKVEVKVV